MVKCLNCSGMNKENARFCRHCGAPIVEQASFSTRLQLGTVLDGRYKIIDYVAKGGMGAVYKAVDLTISGIWAVKEMLDYFDNEKEREYAINRFATEAQILYELDHESIPKFVDCFISENRYYLIMEFVEGIDLRKQLEDAQEIGKQGLEEWDVTNWSMQLCDVLHYLHSQDPPIIYRDLKPGNIIVSQENKVFLIDFGIARLFDPRTKGTMVGTQGYAPPEQYRGQAEPRSDQYSLAACMHHLLTGKDPRNDVPFTFPLIRTIRQDLSEKMEKVLEKSLAMDPETRFYDLMEMREALMAPQYPPVAPVTLVPPESQVVQVTQANNMVEFPPLEEAEEQLIPPPEGQPVESEVLMNSILRDLVTNSKGNVNQDVGLSEEESPELVTIDHGIEMPAQDIFLSPEEMPIDPIQDMELDRELAELNKLEGVEKADAYYAPVEPMEPAQVDDEYENILQEESLTALEEELFPNEFGSDGINLPIDDIITPGLPIPEEEGLMDNGVLAGDDELTPFMEEFPLSGAVEVDLLPATPKPVPARPQAPRSPWYMFRQDRTHSASSQYGYSIKGQLEWNYKVGSPIRSSPVISANGTIYFGANDGFLYAVSSRGKLLWKYETKARILSSPSLDGSGNVYVGSNDCYLHALTPDGNLMWKFRTYGRLRSSPCIERDGTVYAGSYDHYMYAIRPDGQLKWRINLGGYLEATPALAKDGSIYVASRGTYNGSSYFYCLDRGGNVRWYTAIKSPIRSSPCISKKGAIFFGGMDGNLYAINPDGSPRWKFKSSGPIASSPVSNGKNVVIVGSSDRNVYCLNSINGAMKWKYQTFSSVVSSPIIGANRAIYVGGDDYFIYSLDTRGKIRWRLKTGGRVRSSPSIGSDDTLYVGSDDGFLYAIK